MIVALALALIVQSQRASVLEGQLRIELRKAKLEARADEAVRWFLGDLGIVILKDVEKVELLQIGRAKDNQGYSRTPTGKVFSKEFGNRIARLVLDKKHYGYIGASDDIPDPQVGLRLWRGKDSIDLLFSPVGSTPPSSHLGVWVFVTPEHGDIFKIEDRQMCFSDHALEKLVIEANAPD
jgi:hypothetical protein